MAWLRSRNEIERHEAELGHDLTPEGDRIFAYRIEDPSGRGRGSFLLSWLPGYAHWAIYWAQGPSRRALDPEAAAAVLRFYTLLPKLVAESR